MKLNVFSLFLQYSNTVVKNVPLEIFGFWQTKEYEPPTAENGIVPRNAYGNVELFKECMLPKKTVHLQCEFELIFLKKNLAVLISGFCIFFYSSGRIK